MNEEELPSTLFEIRPCKTFPELDACVALQRETWGLDDGDVVPRRVFVVARHIGGQVLGAFRADDPKELVAFAMAIPGIRDRAPYLHSHMLAVTPEYRNRGVGRALKLAQRHDAIHRGIDTMEWTFDPLEAKNAFFNIARLGAVCCRYGQDVYGASSSRLGGGLPTDRLYAEWRLRSERVRAASEGGRASVQPPVQARIALPAELAEWRHHPAHYGDVLALQSANRQRFQELFAQGLTVTGFTRESDGGGYFELSR